MSIISQSELEEEAFKGTIYKRKPTGDDPISDWLLK